MTNIEITFELFGATYTRKANGYCYAQYNGETAKTHRIGKAEFEAKYAEFQMMDKTLTEIENEEIAQVMDEMAEDPEVSLEQFCEVVEKANQPKKKSPKAKKNAAYNGNGITLTAKQVDFIQHLPDTCFWEKGLDSCIWVDCLCDDIGGQFENKPMTVGAMISTICEKGLGVRTKDRINGRKATAFQLTELGKAVARDLGL